MSIHIGSAQEQRDQNIIVHSTPQILIATYPPIAGWLCWPGGVRVAMTSKPTRWARLWYRVLLGWTWQVS